MSDKIFIGIDPDVDESGVTIIQEALKSPFDLTIQKLKFFELYHCLKYAFTYTNDMGKEIREPIKIYIEAGWLNQKSNWHSEGKGENVASRIGKNVGANHQVGKLIAEMCEYLKLEYELVQPRTSKMPVKLFRKMTKYTGKLDQDMVDAAMLVYGRV